MYASGLNSFSQAPALMHRYLPDIKLIYVVRHPLDRIVSQWRHRKGRQASTRDFTALMSSRHLRKLVVGCSLYNERLQRFRAFYPDDQIHCLTFEELIAEPRGTLHTLLSFLGASSAPAHLELLLDAGRLPRVNEAGDKGRQLVPAPAWSDRLRDQVLEVIRPDAHQMLAYMGKPTSTWEL